MLSEQSNSLHIVWHSNDTHTHTHVDTRCSNLPNMTVAEFSQGCTRRRMRRWRRVAPRLHRDEVAPPTWPSVHPAILLNRKEENEKSGRATEIAKQTNLSAALIFPPPPWSRLSPSPSTSSSLMDACVILLSSHVWVIRDERKSFSVCGY